MPLPIDAAAKNGTSSLHTTLFCMPLASWSRISRAIITVCAASGARRPEEPWWIRVGRSDAWVEL